MSILQGGFEIEGLEANHYLSSFLRVLFKRGYICENGIRIIFEGFESFSWRLIKNNQILATCSKLITKKGELIRLKNKNKLIKNFDNDSLKVSNKRLFSLIIKLELLSELNKDKIVNYKNLQKTYSMLIAIFLDDLKQIQQLSHKKK